MGYTEGQILLFFPANYNVMSMKWATQSPNLAASRTRFRLSFLHFWQFLRC